MQLVIMNRKWYHVWYIFSGYHFLFQNDDPKRHKDGQSSVLTLGTKIFGLFIFKNMLYSKLHLCK